MLIKGDVNIIIEQYDKYLSDLLDKHTTEKKIYVVDRPLNDWMTENILTLISIRRKNVLFWRKTRNTINFDIYYDSCKAVKKLFIKENQNRWNKGSLIVKVTIHFLLESKPITVLPEYTRSFTWASTLNSFIDKLTLLKWNFLFRKRVYQCNHFLI